MAAVELVDGDGWISDESSFYGDEATRSKLEDQANRGLKRTCPDIFTHPPSKIAKTESKSTETEDVKSGPSRTENALDFLKNRPQIANLEKAPGDDRRPIKEEVVRSGGGEASDSLDENRFEGDPSAWQQHETINDFLKRAPVADPATACLGPWLWVCNPKITWSQKQDDAKRDVGSFVKGGVTLLKDFTAQRLKLESEKLDASPATITRLLRPNREQLEHDLLALAVRNGTTSGKWMLFPELQDYPRYWRLVAEATAEGRLGPTSKAATLDPLDPSTLICVYTHDFTDTDDVRRVLEGLVDIGLCQKDGKLIYYKCDAYTYLDIKSDNSYKVKASLYNSKEILSNETRATGNGPIAKLKKRNHTTDSFFAS